MFRFIIADSPDRDELIAEIWQGDEMIAEVIEPSVGSTESFQLIIYPKLPEGSWNLDFDEFNKALLHAKDLLRR